MQATKRTCLTCSSKKNKHNVSKWMKEEGIYTMLPRALTCEDKYNAHKNTLKEETPPIKNTQLDVELKIEEGNSWVFYWASEPLDTKDLSPVKDAKEAYNGYGNENNRGLVKTDEKGNAKLVLNCPDVYRDEGNLYPRHVHYSVLDSDNNWSETIGTLEVICKFPYEVMKHIVESKNKVIINALPPEEFEKRHIPNSVNLYYKELEGKTRTQRYRKVKSLIKSTLKKPVMYPPIKEFLDDKEHRTTDVPIIVYCLNEGCPSAEKLVDLIYESGFMNVIMYPGGIEEWFEKEKSEEKSSSKEVLFDDAGEEEEEKEEEEEEAEDKEEEEKEEEEQEEEEQEEKETKKDKKKKKKEEEDKEEDKEEEAEEEEKQEEEIKVEKEKKKKKDKKEDEEDDKEILIYDDLKYVHYFEDDVVMDENEDEDVGTWDGENIVWKDDKTYKNHLKKMRKMKKEEEEDEEEEKEEKKEADKEEENEEEDEEDEEDEEEAEDKEDKEDKEDEDSASEIGLGDDISFSSESDDEDEDEEDDEKDDDSNVQALKSLIKKVNKKVGGYRADINKYDGGSNGINYTSNSYCGGWGFRFVK